MPMIKYNLYDGTDALLASGITSPYDHPHVGTIPGMYVKATEGTCETISNSDDGTGLAAPLSITWDTQSADTKVTAIGGTLGSMQYTNDGGSTWSNISGSKQILATGTGPYELKELNGGEVTTCKFDDVTGSDGFNGNMSVSGGVLTACYQMFYHMDKLVTLDLTGFNTSSVASMGYMFSRCNMLTSLDLTPLDTTLVTNMSSMFSGCTQIINPDTTLLDMSSVTDIGGMFQNCTNLETIDFSHLTQPLTAVNSLLSGCSSLITANLSGLDMTNVAFGTATGIGMFLGATGNINCSNWILGTTGNSLFSGFIGTNLDLTGWNTNSTTNMYRMFYGCSGLTSLDLTPLDTTLVTNMSSMFQNATTLTCISNIDTTSVPNMTNMFFNTPALIQPDAAAITDITDANGADWVHPTTCP